MKLAARDLCFRLCLIARNNDSAVPGPLIHFSPENPLKIYFNACLQQWHLEVKMKPSLCFQIQITELGFSVAQNHLPLVYKFFKPNQNIQVPYSEESSLSFFIFIE